MKRQALIAATFIIAAFIVATVFVEVASAQQPVASSKKSTAPTPLNPYVIYYRPYRPIYRPIYRPPIYYPPVYHRPIVIV